MPSKTITGILFLLSGCAPSTTSSAPDADPGAAFDQTRVALQGGVMTINADTRYPVSTSEVAVPADRLWEVLPAAYAGLGLEVNRGDARTRTLGFEDIRLQRVDGNRLSMYLDCGRGVAGPNADTQEVTMRMATQIAPASSGSEVRVQIEAFARSRAHSGGDIPCRTTGELESRMVEVLQELAG